MPNVFVVSDTHFGHENMYKFTNRDGSKVRPWSTAEEGDEVMVERWNSVVKPNDIVYHLGDVVIARKNLNLFMPRLNGSKRLIMGNHDIFDVVKDYLPHFKRVAAYHVLPGESMIFSHVPIVMTSERFKLNVHGHTHAHNAHGEVGPNPERHFCACVEWTNYTPIALEDIRKAV